MKTFFLTISVFVCALGVHARDVPAIGMLKSDIIDNYKDYIIEESENLRLYMEYMDQEAKVVISFSDENKAVWIDISFTHFFLHETQANRLEIYNHVSSKLFELGGSRKSTVIFDDITVSSTNPGIHPTDRKKNEISTVFELDNITYALTIFFEKTVDLSKHGKIQLSIQSSEYFSIFAADPAQTP